MADLSDAFGQMPGIKIWHSTVSGLPVPLGGIQFGRHQFSMGPVGDFPQRQQSRAFVDRVREFVVSIVASGNPLGIQKLADSCCKRVAVTASGSAEKVIQQPAAECSQGGKPEAAVPSHSDRPSAVLAVRSKRADAFVSSQAGLT